MRYRKKRVPNRESFYNLGVAHMFRIKRAAATFVSKNGLPLVRFFTLESKAGREGPREPVDRFQRFLTATITSYLEIALPCNSDFDLIAFFQIECLDNCRGKAYCQAISPARNLHRYTLTINSVRAHRHYTRFYNCDPLH